MLIGSQSTTRRLTKSKNKERISPRCHNKAPLENCLCGALKNMDWHRSELTRVKDLLEVCDKPPHDDILIRAFGLRRQIE